MINLLIDKELTPETHPPNTTETSRTRRAFGESATFPAEAHAPVRVATFFLQDVIHGDSIVESPVTLLVTEEHVAAFVMINL
jgi:hypothetical protein